MSAIISKAQRSTAIVADTSIEPWKRIWQGLQALSGVTISNLSDSAREFVEAQFVGINEITSGYDLQINDDYAFVDDADIDEILKRVETITNALIDSEVERVMSGLREKTNKVPRSEIEDVRQHKGIFVPLLIGAMEQAVASARAGGEPDGETHFFAAFLLAELEVNSAFPVLLDGFTLRDGAFDLFGDAVPELLPSALALFSRDSTDKIDEILQDTRMDMYVRWSASSAYAFLVRDGTITRDAAVAKLHEQLKQCIAQEDDELVAPIICQLADLAADEALETIKAAYDRDLVDTCVADLKFVESQIADGEITLQDTFRHCRPTGMPDTIAELSRWAAFREEPSQPAENPVPRNPLPRPKSLRRDSGQLEPVATLRSDRAGVGGNHPCPCGSGKKFKTCCR